jgi:hypothetical protein
MLLFAPTRLRAQIAIQRNQIATHLWECSPGHSVGADRKTYW